MSKRRLQVKITGLDDFGRGICKTDGQTYFIPGLLVGEEAIVETSFKFGKLNDLKVIKRLNSSPDRTESICPYYPQCGGCQLLHLRYESQLEYKRQKVQNLLHKFSGLDIKVEETISSNPHFEFRNKVQKPVRKVNGKLELGFYKTDSHELIPVKKCLMETPLSQKISREIHKLLVKYRYEPYDEDKGTGYIRHILIKTSRHYNEALVTIVSTTDKIKGRLQFAKELIGNVKEIKGVVLNINPRHTNVILGEKNIPIYGYTHIKDRIFDNDFLISTKSFYQTNPYQIENLYGTAIKKAQLKATDVVLDAYCGTGTIGISLAKNVKQVVGVELEIDAVKDAIKYAKLNNLNNICFINQDCTEYMLKSQKRFDVIIMDPPRKGSTNEFLEAVNQINPRTVVYISCEPSTLARDLKHLLKRYRVISVTPVDMFPNTFSVETIAVLKRK